MNCPFCGNEGQDIGGRWCSRCREKFIAHEPTSCYGCRRPNTPWVETPANPNLGLPAAMRPICPSCWNVLWPQHAVKTTQRPFYDLARLHEEAREEDREREWWTNKTGAEAMWDQLSEGYVK